MAKHRVLHCVSSLKVGGAEKCAINLAQVQQQQGFDVSVLSYGTHGEPFEQILNRQNIPIIHANGSVLSRARQVAAAVTCFDLIHIHSPSVIRAFLPIFPFLLLRNVIYTHHGELSPNQAGMRLSHWIAALYIRKDFAVSAKVKQSVRERYNWNPNHTELIENGVMLQDDAISLPSMPFRFGCVGRMVPLKQVSQVVNAFSSAGLAGQSELHLFGDGPERPSIETSVREKNLGEVVKFHGTVLDEDDIYRHFDCLVINSTTEGLPMVMLEALARGKPVISTPVGQIPTLNARLQFALLVDQDSNQLGTAMRTLATDIELWKALAQNGKELVKESYSIIDVSNRYLKYLV